MLKNTLGEKPLYPGLERAQYNRMLHLYNKTLLPHQFTPQLLSSQRCTETPSPTQDEQETPLIHSAQHFASSSSRLLGRTCEPAHFGPNFPCTYTTLNHCVKDSKIHIPIYSL